MNGVDWEGEVSTLPNGGVRPGWCKHYRGRVKGVVECHAGVSYSRFDGTGMNAQPCFLDQGKPKPGAGHCEHLRLPTDEEMALAAAYMTDRFAKMAAIGPSVKAFRDQHLRGPGTTAVSCLACDGIGTLHMTIASNGHVHGRCTTPGCVSWMQ